MNTQPSLRKNPSRETCEKMIRRILMTEVLEKGTNETFRQASDFMTYFESLYPASESLTKQVQRAIKSLDLPKDENGFFIIHKTKEQLAQESELRHLFQENSANLDDMEDCETLFIQTDPFLSDYLLHTLTSWDSLRNKYITMLKTCNGILIYTREKSLVSTLLKSVTDS